MTAEGGLHNFASQGLGGTVMLHILGNLLPLLFPKLPWQLADSCVG